MAIAGLLVVVVVFNCLIMTKEGSSVHTQTQVVPGMADARDVMAHRDLAFAGPRLSTLHVRPTTAGSTGQIARQN